MRAEQAAVSNMVSLKMDELCEDCPFRQKLSGDVFAYVGGRSATGVGTELYVGGDNDLEGFAAERVIRPADIIEAFNDCERAVNNGSINPKKLSCGAIVRLEHRKGKNG